MAKQRTPGRRQEPLDSWPTLRQTLISLTSELGRFPTPHDLERRGRYDVMRALVRQGGSAAVAKRLQRDVEVAMAQTEAATSALAG